jgi:ubiquinone/menaquinone biosynthesis C-methylase UbiE
MSFSKLRTAAAPPNREDRREGIATFSSAKDWDKLAPAYAHSNVYKMALQPPEQKLLHRFRGRWQEIDMLDVGVGAGRTAYTFAPVARSYVGIDFSPQMIEFSRRLVREDETIRFAVADARDLSQFAERAFDLVLFSFNGIDLASLEDREVILREIRRVVSADGCFAFQSHSLDAFERPIRRFRPSRPRTTYRSLRKSVRFDRVNPDLDLDAARARGWALVRDPEDDLALPDYYVSAGFQLGQLEKTGFRGVEVWDDAGRPIDPTRPQRSKYLFYVCEAAGSS